MTSIYPATAAEHPATAVRVNSGRLIDLANPRADDILLADIATGLAHQQRFTGHCPLEPTIAQHSLAVAWIAGELYAQGHYNDHSTKAALDVAREALMHDAAEAYVSDLSSPAKLALRAVLKGAAARNSGRERAALSAFDKLEALAHGAIREHFALTDDWGELVHEADVLAYEYESGWAGWNPYAASTPWVRYVQRFYSTPYGGRAAFLRRAAGLGLRDA